MNNLRGNTKGFLSRQRKDMLKNLISSSPQPVISKHLLSTGQLRNLSQCKLTDTDLNILGKGVNHAVTPDKIQYEDFILATELAC